MATAIVATLLLYTVSFPHPLDSFLDWAIVAIPALVGSAAWFVPIKESTRAHKVILSMGCVGLSGLIYLQQYRTRVSHLRELSNFATKNDVSKLASKEDLAKLPEILRTALKATSPSRSKMPEHKLLTVPSPESRTEGSVAGRLRFTDNMTSAPTIRSVGMAGTTSGDSFAVAPRSLASIFGSNFAERPASAQNAPLPTTFETVSVTVNGEPAPLVSVRADQIDFQVPNDTVPGTANVVVMTNGQSSDLAHLTVAPTAPHIFADDMNHAGALNQDYTNNRDKPAKVGTFVALYATGLGSLNYPVSKLARSSSGLARAEHSVGWPKVQPTVTVGAEPVVLSYAGASPASVAGVDEINFIVPNLPTGAYAVVITQGRQKSNAPLLNVTR